MTRIWAAIQRLSPETAPQASDVAPAKEESKKSPAKPDKRAKPQKGATAPKRGTDERRNRKVDESQ